MAAFTYIHLYTRELSGMTDPWAWLQVQESLTGTGKGNLRS